jgi:D-glycero-D-manno-heptose 1,7-bisphosphate phosphatase
MPDKIKAVFLDRDGVLNQEMGDYVRRFEDFHVLDNFDALKTLQDRGYMLLVATNQGGIGQRMVYRRGTGKNARAPKTGLS